MGIYEVIGVLKFLLLVIAGSYPVGAGSSKSGMTELPREVTSLGSSVFSVGFVMFC